jgi:hypothetical protein
MDELPRTPPAPAAPTPDERRRHARAAVVWMATLRTKRGLYGCLVIDISRGGAKLSILDGPAIEPGEAVTLDLAPCGMYAASAVWQRTEYIGIRFADPPEAVAAQMDGVP